MSLDLAAYRRDAETFVGEIDREYYLHLAGHQPRLDIEPIYERHASLFEARSVAAIREEAARAAAGTEEARRLRFLLAFALDGCIGRETRAEAAETAALEATLEVTAAGDRVGYRQVPVELANEPDGVRRAELEAARDEVLSSRLNPLYVSALERSHELCRSLGWDGYAAAYADVRGFDLRELERQAAAFLEASAPVYARLMDARLAAAGLPSLGELRRSDVPRLLRAPELDELFPAAELVPSLQATLGGLGVDLGAQPNVHLDTEPRPTKSPRAFCSPVRVPDEIYLVIAPVGGRDDFAALFHEAGHTEHYANTRANLPFEFRHLGDNSVTESFAFLLDHLTADPLWLEDCLGVADTTVAVADAQASKLLFLRRYGAKLTYELELHAPAPDLALMPARYAEVQEAATRIRWPRAAWVSDVDEGFYVACYLRAWALETHWRRALRERFGERWFASADAGRWLLRLWEHGQRLDGDELLAQELGETLDFGAVATDFENLAG
jgi:hypothetical protein